MPWGVPNGGPGVVSKLLGSSRAEVLASARAVVALLM